MDRLTKESNNTVWEENKTFVDPACGDGNFLVEVLKRKLKNNHDPIKALESIFGADIMQDNISECRLRLFKIVKEFLKTKTLVLEAIKILKVNIKCVSLKNYPNGSLDYDFSFNDKKITDEDAEKILKNIIGKNNEYK